MQRNKRGGAQRHATDDAVSTGKESRPGFLTTGELTEHTPFVFDDAIEQPSMLGRVGMSQPTAKDARSPTPQAKGRPMHLRVDSAGPA